MNRRRLCQLTTAILTSDLTTRTYVDFMKRHSDYHVTVPAPSRPNSMAARARRAAMT